MQDLDTGNRWTCWKALEREFSIRSTEWLNLWFKVLKSLFWVSQKQLYLMNGVLYGCIFRGQRNHHQAINTKYLNHISSWFFHIRLYWDTVNYLLNHGKILHYSVARVTYFLLFEVSILLWCMDNQGSTLKNRILNCYE